MTQSQQKTVVCIRCGHRWTEDLARLAKPDSVIYKGEQKLRVIDRQRASSLWYWVKREGGSSGILNPIPFK